RRCRPRGAPRRGALGRRGAHGTRRRDARPARRSARPRRVDRARGARRLRGAADSAAAPALHGPHCRARARRGPAAAPGRARAHRRGAARPGQRDARRGIAPRARAPRPRVRARGGARPADRARGHGPAPGPGRPSDAAPRRDPGPPGTALVGSPPEPLRSGFPPGSASAVLADELFTDAEAALAFFAGELTLDPSPVALAAASSALDLHIVLEMTSDRAGAGFATTFALGATPGPEPATAVVCVLGFFVLAAAPGPLGTRR